MGFCNVTWYRVAKLAWLDNLHKHATANKQKVKKKKFFVRMDSGPKLHFAPFRTDVLHTVVPLKMVLKGLICDQ